MQLAWPIITKDLELKPDQFENFITVTRGANGSVSIKMDLQAETIVPREVIEDSTARDRYDGDILAKSYMERVLLDLATAVLPELRYKLARAFTSPDESK